jgi:uncharacterized membrane protein YkoI
LTVFLSVALLTVMPNAASARAATDEIAQIRAAVAHGTVLPLPRILAVAQHRVPGEVLKVELEEEHGRLDYEVKILTVDGRVREVTLDARTGAIRKVEND